MATASPQQVFTGFWINWAGGKILGSTLTLSAENGRYLVALLALFVRVAGANCWGIICFATFRLRSTTKAHDGLFHQQQAILRNNTSDGGALWQLLQSGHRWRGRVSKPILRSFQLILLATLNLAFFAIGGVFSSRIVTASSEVLLVPQDCGIWSFSIPSNDNVTMETNNINWWIYWEEIFAQAFNLAPLCYNGTQPVSSEACPISGRQLPPWSMSSSDACPFADSLCAGNISVAFDSGFVDSLYDLGINSRPEERIQYKQTCNCAPLDIGPYLTKSQGLNSSLVGANTVPFLLMDQTLQWDYLLLGYNMEFEAGATFSFSNETFNNSNVVGNVLGYETLIVDVEDYYPGANVSTFYPIPELRNDDLLLTLFILLNGGNYVEPVFDPWYNATKAHPWNFIWNTPGTEYVSDQVISAIGCTSDYIICNPQDSAQAKCQHFSMLSSPLGLVDVPSDTLGLSPVQKLMIERIINATSGSTMISAPNILGSQGLLAQDYSDGFVTSLPDNQWILELQNWFSMSAIALQLSSTSYIQQDQLLTSFNKSPMPADAEWMCHNQIVRRDDYTSFSVLGVFIILGLGCVIIVTNLGLSEFMTRLQRKTPISQHRIWEWTAQGTLQLQRHAYDGHELGNWEGEDSYPVTRADERFTFLQVNLEKEKAPTTGPTEDISLDKEKSADSISIKKVPNLVTQGTDIPATHSIRHSHEYESLPSRCDSAASETLAYSPELTAQCTHSSEATEEIYTAEDFGDSQQGLLPWSLSREHEPGLLAQVMGSLSAERPL